MSFMWSGRKDLNLRPPAPKAEQLRRQEEAKRRELEIAKRVDLESRLEEWDKEARITDFANMVETTANASGKDASPQSELGRWLIPLTSIGYGM